MRRIRVAFATFVCVAFLGVSAGTADAGGYGKYSNGNNNNGSSSYCTITLTGIPEGVDASVSVYYGDDDLEEGDTFKAKNGKTIKLRAEVGDFDGPWFSYDVNCDETLDVSERFCLITIAGIPEGGSIYIKGFGTVANGDTLTVPHDACYKFRASVGELDGEWESAKFDCEATDDILSFAEFFCELTLSGIPEDCELADVEIEDVGTDLENEFVFWAPDGACLRYRATVQGINGPWHSEEVCCDDGGLDTSKRWVHVTWILKWTTEGETQFQDAPELTVANGESYCFPKCACVFARPNITPEADYDGNEFDEDSTVYWKLISSVVEDDNCDDNNNKNYNNDNCDNDNCDDDNCDDDNCDD